MNQDKMGKFIYEQRKKMNLTQSQLAEKLMVTSQAVSKWENGRGIPDIEMLNRLSEVFCVDIKDIINGEEQEKNSIIYNKKNYVIFGIILFLTMILLLIFVFGKEEDFNFHSLSSNNSCFGVNGVIAYNKNKKSIYISNIECSDEEVREYLDIECVLYEEVGNMDKKIQEYGKIKDFNEYDLNNVSTLNELLSSIEFNIDDYDCSCLSNSCDNLYIRIDALNIDNKVITYNIPIKLDNKCVK